MLLNNVFLFRRFISCPKCRRGRCMSPAPSIAEPHDDDDDGEWVGVPFERASLPLLWFPMRRDGDCTPLRALWHPRDRHVDDDWYGAIKSTTWCSEWYVYTFMVGHLCLFVCRLAVCFLNAMYMQQTTVARGWRRRRRSSVWLVEWGFCSQIVTYYYLYSSWLLVLLLLLLVAVLKCYLCVVCCILLRARYHRVFAFASIIFGLFCPKCNQVLVSWSQI